MPVPSSRLRFALADGWLRQVLLFLAAYLLYGASRWVLTGDEATALEHAHWIVELEATLGIAVEASVQRALDGTALLWLLNHAYVAAQLVVVPAALIWLYRRDKPAYRRLRDTVLATWLLALPVFWLLPVAPATPGRSRDRRHDHTADRAGAGLQAHHQLLQPPRRRPLAALRLRARGLARPGGQRTTRLDARAIARVGADDLPRRRGHRQPLRLRHRRRHRHHPSGLRRRAARGRASRTGAQMLGAAPRRAARAGDRRWLWWVTCRAWPPTSATCSMSCSSRPARATCAPASAAA
jgi:hypothetical protein